MVYIMWKVDLLSHTVLFFCLLSAPLLVLFLVQIIVTLCGAPGLRTACENLSSSGPYCFMSIDYHNNKSGFKCRVCLSFKVVFLKT